MGENIIGIAIYYPQVSSKLDGMENGKLKLSIPDVCNSFLKCGAIEFEIEEGSVIVFSNQGYHQLPLMQYGHHIKTNGNAISRTILTFFIINQNNSKDVKASDDKLLCNIVNIEFYWRYYVLNMLRNNELMNNNKSSTSYEWMFGLVQLFLFEDNYKDYVWYKRYKMRHEKNKPLFRTILADNDSNLMCEESSYYPYDGEVEY